MEDSNNTNIKIEGFNNRNDKIDIQQLDDKVEDNIIIETKDITCYDKSVCCVFAKLLNKIINIVSYG
jgi:hypothetical protein